MKKYKSQSTTMPNEWDLTSSGTTNYHNINIIIIPQTEDNPLMYDYEVEEFAKEEYESFINENRMTTLEAKQAEVIRILAEVL